MVAITSVLIGSGLMAGPASAAGDDSLISVRKVANATCDIAAGKVRVRTSVPASIGIKQVGTRKVLWRKREVNAGAYTVRLKPQRFGSSKKFVVVLSPLDDQAGLSRSRRINVVRPTVDFCVPGPVLVSWDGSGAGKDAMTCAADDHKIRLWAVRGFIWGYGDLNIKYTDGMAINGDTYSTNRVAFFVDYEEDRSVDALNVSDTHVLVYQMPDAARAKINLAIVNCHQQGK